MNNLPPQNHDIDGQIAHTGGVNWQMSISNYIERFGYWKDSGIFRLDGSSG